MSLRCVMMEKMLLSPIPKTRSTISCSTSCTLPSSAPSRTTAFISSSVTFSFFAFSPIRWHIAAVLLISTHTKGDATTDSTVIGRDTSIATRSAAAMPMRLGTSSPMMSVRYVTMMTMMSCAIVVA